MIIACRKVARGGAEYQMRINPVACAVRSSRPRDEVGDCAGCTAWVDKVEAAVGDPETAAEVLVGITERAMERGKRNGNSDS